MSEFWKNRDGCESRGSRSACSLLKTRRYEAPARFAGRKDTARVTRYPLVMHGSRDSCSLRLVRRKHRVSFVPAGDPELPCRRFSLARKATWGVGFRFAQDNPLGQASVREE